MKVCLVSPATVTEFSSELAESEAIQKLAEHAPVGILTLASILEAEGYDFTFYDTNTSYYDYIRCPNNGEYGNFREYILKNLLEINFDVIGLGTICSTYPLTISLAQAIRRIRPNVKIILGGPQASAVDIATMESFDCVDFIVRYEAEETLPMLLSALQMSASPILVPGITYRDNGNNVRRTKSPPVIEDLDRLPLPAFDLYPPIKTAKYIPLELGRGCPYACTFCSTNDFFRRKFRLKTPSLIVDQMLELKSTYMISTFDLIHDMFTVDRKKVVEFCQSILDSGERFFWNCSARTDRIDSELMELMSLAGCRGIFFGIEAGSQRLQKIVDKNLVLSDSLKKIDTACGLGINTAVSLITGFPDETLDDFYETADFFVKALAFENSIPQLHILAPLADTPLHRQYKKELKFDDIVSDMSHQGWDQTNQDRDMISTYPDIFPNFYAIPTPLDREYVKNVRLFLLHGAKNFSWLYSALHQDNGHILNVYDNFSSWLNKKNKLENKDIAEYYQSPRFHVDFFEYLRTEYINDTDNRDIVLFLCKYFCLIEDIGMVDPTADLSRATDTDTDRVRYTGFKDGSIPVLSNSVAILEAPIDICELRAVVRNNMPLASIEKRRTTVASRKKLGEWPETIQLSEASEKILSLCDGNRTVGDIKNEGRNKIDAIDGIEVGIAIQVGLEILRYDGLVCDINDAR